MTWIAAEFLHFIGVDRRLIELESRWVPAERLRVHPGEEPIRIGKLLLHAKGFRIGAVTPFRPEFLILINLARLVHAFTYDEMETAVVDRSLLHSSARNHRRVGNLSVDQMVDFHITSSRQCGL